MLSANNLINTYFNRYASKDSRKQASQAANKYTNELQGYHFDPDNLRQTWLLRVRQVTCYAFLVACFPNYAYTESIDQFLFLEVFYKRIKDLEKCGARLEHDVLTLTGIYTYRNIIAKFKEIFREKLTTSSNLSGLLHRLYISQGDLERYLQTFANVKDFSYAIKSYKSACNVLKHSGKPHHQLAVISLQMVCKDFFGTFDSDINCLLVFLRITNYQLCFII